METKHTPAPWLMDSTNRAHEANPNYYTISDKDGKLIALLPLPSDEEFLATALPICEANFKLVSATPLISEGVVNFKSLITAWKIDGMSLQELSLLVALETKFDDLIYNVIKKATE